jgi:AcrR family transcriptional regulator
MNSTLKVHMGQTLELIIRKNELNLTELATEVGVDRRTFYYWFKKEVLKESTINRISRVINSDNLHNSIKTNLLEPCFSHPAEISQNKGEDDYWKDKYVELLERYTALLKSEGPVANLLKR